MAPNLQIRKVNGPSISYVTQSEVFNQSEVSEFYFIYFILFIFLFDLYIFGRERDSFPVRRIKMSNPKRCVGGKFPLFLTNEISVKQ